MEIKVTEISKELNKLNNLIDNYENNYLNFYNIITEISLLWQDGYSKIFFDNITSEKKKEQTTIGELKYISNIYSYIVNKYNGIGNKITFNFTYEEKLIKKYNNYIDYIDTNINLYNSLDLENWNSFSNRLKEEKNKLMDIKHNTELIKYNLKEKINQIKEYEKNIKFNLSKLDIESIKESDISYFDKDIKNQTNNNSFIKEDELNSCIEKLLLYTNEENIILSDILLSISTINSYYNTENKLNNIYDELLKKFNIIKLNHFNNIDILKKTIIKYNNTVTITQRNFDNIDIGGI